MSQRPTKEDNFEDAIEHWLVTHVGYESVSNQQYNAELAIDPTTLLAFIQATQPEVYQALSASYGSQVDTMMVNRIASECDKRGLLDVIRNGVRDRGQSVRLAYFKPASSLNPETEALYQQNRLTVMRQVYYDLGSRNCIDMVLFINGMPIATVELKNQFTGQNWTHAVKQYKKDRVPSRNTPLLQFKKRALVHFAVDTDEAYMATKLAGDKTFFLPFNTGNDGGKGNPDQHDYQTGYKTGYLWEQVWQRDSWLDLVHRFIHLQVEEEKDKVTGKITSKETMIFPRYHQMDAVRKMVAVTLRDGVGENRLIQHSAGSGKTNTISWTAHQLASLHDELDRPLFNSVIVISDRRNLDKQLQDNVFAIEHKHGVVEKIDDGKHASDLAAALNSGVKIIITTLQKFSFLLDKVNDFSHKRFAVIVDEAHSSTGSTHTGNLKKALGAIPRKEGETEEEHMAAVFEAAASEDNKLVEEPGIEDLINDDARSSGKQPNISFFAFTATPKHKTLTLFGTPDATGYPRPFHLYSMRQAIEENFIHDVLKFYTTYKTYFKLTKAVQDDPEVDEKKAKRAINAYLSLHPTNLAQKTEIMVEHFRNFTRKKIGGKAKAMLVTKSRLHAVRYKQEFDKYIAANGYNDVKALVAFSGSVDDPDLDTVSYTEAEMNGFSEKELPAKFGTPEYHILIVAEKYQTGFDQPLLHTMFVDKKLGDVKAVQTLSRLNRTTGNKKDTFVLDFENTMEDMVEAFQPYYEVTTVDEPTDPNILYNFDSKLRAAPVLRQLDIDEFAKVFFKDPAKQNKRDHGKYNQWIDPAVSRYKAEYRDQSICDYEAYTDEGEAFKSNLRSFVRLYSFLSQVVDFVDVELHKLFAYGSMLLTKLPYRSNAGSINLDEEVALESYRLEKTYEGSGTLAVNEEHPVYGPTEVGTGGGQEDHTSPLSEVIKLINDRYGAGLSEEDSLLIEQIAGDMASDAPLTEKMRANTKDQVKPVFEIEVMNAFVNRHERNEKIVGDFLQDEGFRNLLITALFDDVYRRVTKETEGVLDGF
ncbi:restriction endonuclease subunit R [Bacterioplanes sanyensis]|uniref:Restriction endonuclease subunit R n=1 Tax=Bacterioplanes sanyensis TaxID=1249553 RepID=A0A222FKN7_9GAMM|nr:type I restriction endonuclease [Bacterioplanes sanyensis]ASP39595.1 restriction endonuclease subunit R [Bacterioplanes sanyensis]